MATYHRLRFWPRVFKEMKKGRPLNMGLMQEVTSGIVDEIRDIIRRAESGEITEEDLKGEP
jgi:hypothetical protein